MTITDFIAKWKASSGSENANSQPFLMELCQLLGVPTPKPATGIPAQDVYTFEKQAPAFLPGDIKSSRRMDLYKEGCFIWESKQGSDGGKKKGSGVRGTPGYHQMMDDAYGQALGYASSLKERPPFLLICDIGYCIDVYASFDGGRYYPYPNAQHRRLYMQDLEKQLDLLRTIWTEPLSLDPAKRAAKVTKEVADKLARLSVELQDMEAPEEVARFLMRCVFTMFAEDTDLLPERTFVDSLRLWLKNPSQFAGGVAALWEAMNEGRHFGAAGKLLRFNGGLFHEAKGLPLKRRQLELLLEAAEADWREVEPSIFGTLLESALGAKERHQLGAHYTPRAYVERLVRPTIEEPLRAEWELVQAEARQLVLASESAPATKAGQAKAAEHLRAARKVILAFHTRLCGIKILDPACGSGNFLYVSMDMMKRLEGEVLAQLAKLNEGQSVLETLLLTETVSPEQFLGIEIKPWAKEIAELVLWIGYLQWHLRTHGKKSHPPEPVLRNYHNIECRDAVLAFDEEIQVRDADDKPVTRWDGETMMKNLVTGEDVPNLDAQVEIFRYTNPRKAVWPEADFIVGNPPFIGNKRMRTVLGEGYAETIRGVYPEVSGSVDFVMYWWEKAAVLLCAGKILRFGLITTNSITQSQCRKMLQSHMEGENRLSLVYAIADHPWVDAASGAAVRIAMSVASRDEADGVLCEVAKEEATSDDAVSVVLSQSRGMIHSDFTIGADTSAALALRSNESLAATGVRLCGAGFIVTPAEAKSLGLGALPGLAQHIRPYRHGRDLAAISRDAMVIDFFGLTEKQARDKYTAAYQWILERVKPERDQNNMASRKNKWWVLGDPAPAMRMALTGLPRYISTIETAKHRFFVFMDQGILPDGMLINIALDDAYALGVLSSRIHVTWALASGGTLENRPRYNKTRCFDPFPFPAATDLTQKPKIRALGEQLDAHRKRQQAAHPKLTMTGMYNVLAKLRSGDALTAKEKELNQQGLVSILRQIHDDLDDAVFACYGLPVAATDQEILVHLVALNAERAAEEKTGLVRWLRPAFQNPAGATAATQVTLDTPEASEEAEGPVLPLWPATFPLQLASIRDVTRRGGIWSAAKVGALFTGSQVEGVQAALESLGALGLLLSEGSGVDKHWKSA